MTERAAPNGKNGHADLNGKNGHADPNADAVPPVDGLQLARRTGVHAARFALGGILTALFLRRAKFLNLHRGTTPYEAASRVVSVVHATVASIRSLQLAHARGGLKSPFTLFDPWLSGAQGSAPNTAEESEVFAFSSGYWIADLLYLLGYERDPLFVLHHVLTLTIWPQSMASGRGAAVPTLACALGEASTPFLGLWWLAKRAGNTTLEAPLSNAFTASFLPLRVGLLPMYALAFLRAAFSGKLDAVLGAARARLWAVLIAAAGAGSLVWAKALVAGFLKAQKSIKA